MPRSANEPPEKPESLAMEFSDVTFEWRCRNHPKKSFTGVCPICLKQRLSLLCPDCSSLRPCNNCPETPSCSSSSSSSSLSDFSKLSASGIGSVARISFLIDSEPPFRRSKSSRPADIPFPRSKSAKPAETRTNPTDSRKWSSLLSFLHLEKRNKEKTESAAIKLPRSRSVGFSCYSDPGNVPGARDTRSKGWSWSFASPIKVFRQSKAAKVKHERSPLYRG